MINYDELLDTLKSFIRTTAQDGTALRAAESQYPDYTRGKLEGQREIAQAVNAVINTFFLVGAEERCFVRSDYQIGELTTAQLAATGKVRTESQCITEFGEKKWSNMLVEMDDKGSAIIFKG